MNARKIKIAIFSLLSGIRLSVVGMLVLSEVFAVLNVLSLKALGKSYALTPDLKKIHGAFLGYLLALMASDFINHSPLQNLLKGWAAVAMAIVMMTFMFRMFEDSPNVIVVFMMAEIVRLVFFGPTVELETSVILEEHSIFKFRIAPITNNIILLIAYYLYNKDKRQSVIYLFVFYGLLSMALDGRSNGLYFLIAAMVLGFRKYLVNVSSSRVWSVVLVFGLAFQLLYMSYVHSVLTGAFGGAHTREQIDKLENPYNPLYLIMSGRPEVFVAIAAIQDKPLFGHGSWAHDDNNHYRSLMWKDYSAQHLESVALKDAEIPSHSLIFGVWMYSGIIGFFAIMYFCVLVIRRGFYIIQSETAYYTPYYPIVILFTIQLIWTFLFSPVSHIRNDIPVMASFIVVVCCIVREHENAEDEEDEEYEEEEELEPEMVK
jgi:hypothetical protein